jgi:kynureninase
MMAICGIMTNLIIFIREEGVICDVRGQVLRVAPTPLYNTFQGKRRDKMRKRD